MDELTLLVGTYTAGNSSEGVYCYRFNQETAVAEPISTAKVDNPSFMALNAGADKLYVITENNDDWDAVTLYDLDKAKGELRERERVLIGSKSPCYILHGDGWIGIANYGGGTIATFPVGESGNMRPRQQLIDFSAEDGAVSRLHCLAFSPDKEFVFATDLGKDSIYKFRVARGEEIESGEPILTRCEPTVKLNHGDGPRHLTFTADGQFAYLINEKGRSVAVFDYSCGVLQLKQSLRMDEITDCGGGGDIHIAPNGEYLYASNRLKNDGIAIFKINKQNGTLTKVGYRNCGVHPRNFTITPNCRYMLVACKDSNRIELYAIDATSGDLSYMGEEFDIKVDSPVYVQLV